MKRLLRASPIAAIFALLATGCGSASPGTSKPPTPGELVCTTCAEVGNGAYGLDLGETLTKKRNGRRLTGKATFHNGSSGPATFVVPEPQAPTDPMSGRFSCSGCGTRTVDAGASLSINFTFTPGEEPGAPSQSLPLSFPEGRTVTLQLSAAAFDHFLAFDPGDGCVFFGPLEPGSTETKEVSVVNRSSREVKILSVDAVGGGAFSVDAGGLDVLAPAGQEGDRATLRVTYAALDDGVRGFLRVVAEATAGGELKVCLDGSVGTPGTCAAELDPADGKLALGPVAPGASTTQSFRVRSTGDGTCRVGPISLSKGAGVFGLDASSEQTLAVPAGMELEVPVHFRPNLAGSYTETLVVKVESLPDLQVGLTGLAAVPCLRFAGALDMGVVAPACASQTRYLQLENRCDHAVTLQKVGVSAGAPFQTLPMDLPLVFSPNGFAEVGVSSRPQDAPADVKGQLLLTTDEFADPWRVELHGATDAHPHQIDTFQVKGPRLLDVLFVLDSRLADFWGEERLTAGMARDGFLSGAGGSSLDLHLGVTRGDVGDGACALDGRLRPLTGERFLTRDDVLASWDTYLRAGSACDVGPGQLLEAAKRALTPPVSDRADDPRHADPNDGNLGFLRRDAALAVVLVSAQDDASPSEVPGYLQTLRATKPVRRAGQVSVHALFNPPGSMCAGGAAGTRIAQAVQASGGRGADMCLPDLTDPMQLLGGAVFGFESCFELTAAPTGSGSSDGWFQVLVNGKTVPPVGSSNERRWTYRPGASAICFTADGAPRSGDTVRVDYAVACD